MKIAIPSDVLEIINVLQTHGHEAYIVGGCVRDSIRGTVPKDWDITTSAMPQQVAQIFPKTIETGIQHGTITVLVNRNGYEVTTYRIDGEYLDNRRPESVMFTASIKDDLARRDFTMNAIAYSPSQGFVDPFNGRGDIEKKLIRCVGSAKQRFGEDALRMLRAIRFAGQLGFAVDYEISTAIHAQRASLANISPERIREELTRLINSPYVEALGLLERTGLLPYVLIGRVYDGDIGKTIHLLKQCPRHEALRLALFLVPSGEACKDIMRDLRFDNKTIHEVSIYVNMLPVCIPHDRYEIKKHLRQLSPVLFENLLRLQSIINPHDAARLAAVGREAQDIQAKNECYTLRDLSISGDDLIAYGLPHGIAIGEKLEELLDAVMRDPMLNSQLPLIYKNPPKM